MDSLVSLSKRRGFVYPASDIYGGLANSWDYGPLGSIMKENIKNEWLKEFVFSRDDMILIDSAIIQNSSVWDASGHLTKFSDPMVECLDCHKRFRADNLIEDKLGIDVDGRSAEEIDKIINENNIKCPITAGVLSQVKNFNLMFNTKLGPVDVSSDTVYLRPETCQGIFTNFDNIIKSTRLKLPFGVAQIGKSFRNEITPGNFIFRTLEFEQMEIEYFTKEDNADKDFEYWLNLFEEWYKKIGIKKENLKKVELNETQRAHYSKRTVDIYFNYPFGFKELQSFANRSDYDLTSHSNLSGKKLHYFDEESKTNIVPFVIEPSVGLGRLFLAILSNGYKEEIIGNDKRIVLSLSHRIAPYQLAIFPLIGKDEKINNISQNLYSNLRWKYRCTYDSTGSIGKRYRRQDEIGTPLCITIDNDSSIDNTVTIRDRDSMEQVRVNIDNINEYIDKCFL
jgi:glycyl-tRNA synthetase